LRLRRGRHPDPALILKQWAASGPDKSPGFPFRFLAAKRGSGGQTSPACGDPSFTALAPPALAFLNFFARFSISASCLRCLCFFRLDASILE